MSHCGLCHRRKTRNYYFSVIISVAKEQPTFEMDANRNVKGKHILELVVKFRERGSVVTKKETLKS